MAWVGGGLVGVAIFVLVAVLWPTEERPESQLAGADGPTDRRTLRVQRPASERLFGPLVSTVGSRLRRLSPDDMIESTDHKIQMGGLSESWTVERVLAGKLFLAGGGLLVGLLLFGASSLLLVGLLVVVGFLIPDALLTRRSDDRQRKLEREFPDFVDQLSVTVEAGLGFDQALIRVAQTSSGELAGELRRVVRDIQLGMSRSRAMDSLLERTGVEDLGRFVRAVRLAERQGLPLAATLTIQADEARSKRQMRAEEKAMQIPVKLTFPLVLFILPSLFLVVLGPAALSLAGGL